MLSKEFKEIDIKRGEMTLSQRLELPKILCDETITDEQRFYNVFQCLYNCKPKPTEIKQCTAIYERIVEGLQYWAHVEEVTLSGSYSAEERKAGVEQLSKELGALSIVMPIAEKFGVMPDSVFNWQYGQVYSIMLYEKKTNDFRKELEKQIMSKHKAK